MKINIYYGGRGVLDDPTIYVLSQTEKVLGELRVEVNRYNIYESKNSIATLPSTLKGVDGIILATTVEWLGIGGYMTQFLDACWLYGDKDEIARIYMQPIVISTTYGEREAVLTLENAWQILGGQLCSGYCGYVDGVAELRNNPEYHRIIEKKAENLYRTISTHAKNLPGSNQAVRRSVQRTQTMQLTPQESEQLSEYVSDESYVARQKKDIKDLSSMYKNLLGGKEEKAETEFINAFQSHFHAKADLVMTAAFNIKGRTDPLVVRVNGNEIHVAYEKADDAKVIAHLSEGTMNEITSGRETFQRAFNTGDMTAKGTFADLRILDDIFRFS